MLPKDAPQHGADLSDGGICPDRFDQVREQVVCLPGYSIQRLELPPGAWMGVVITPGEGITTLGMPEWDRGNGRHHEG